MGKLKFTLTNIFFWVAMLLISFLMENLLFFSSEMKGGLNLPTLAILTGACLLSLFMFYFIEHKENKIKIDFVLLPAILIFGAFLIIGIWVVKDETFVSETGANFVVSLTKFERIRATIICALFIIFSYTYLFFVHVNKPRSRRLSIICYVGIAAALVSLIYSLCTEMKEYLSIFSDEPIPGLSIDSFYGNKNYYGGVLLIGFLSCIVANYYKPRLYKYLLMIILFLATLASAAMLPTLISAAVLAIYLVEEVIRFACKRKWLYSSFAMISILVVLSLIALFYFAVTKPVKGFIGLNVYLTEMLKSKNFATFTGRTKLWFGIIPHCFDNIMHSIFGHGFLVSEKYMIGLTASINDGDLSGVRTAHNGLVEIMFNYGMVGTVVLVGMVAYFFYSCFRLMLEKRFHFVFVYSLVVFAMLAHNFLESSPFFDVGVKEMYITFTFMMPVIVENKFINRNKKIEELKNIDVDKKTLSPVKFGQTVSLILVALIVCVLPAFVSSMTYSNALLRNWMINIVIFLSILLIFLPYLLSLFYRKGDLPMFALHTAANLLFITLITVLSYIFLKNSGSSMMKYVVPIILFASLLIHTLIYSLIKGGSIKDYYLIFIKGAFIQPRNAIFASLIIGAIISLGYQVFNNMTMYIYLLNMVVGLITFMSIMYFFPTRGGKELINELNEIGLYKTKELVIKDESYYG